MKRFFRFLFWLGFYIAVAIFLLGIIILLVDEAVSKHEWQGQAEIFEQGEPQGMVSVRPSDGQ